MSFGEIKQILNKKIVMDINQEKGSVPLKENDPQSKLKEVEIYGLHKDTVVFKLDYRQLKKKSQYLSDEKGLHSGCDYVIVTRYKEKDFILFLELKSTYKGAAAQLRNSIPFIDYMASLLNIHYNFDFGPERFKRHYIVFVAKRLDKRSPYPGKEPSQKKYKELTIKCFKNTQKINLSKILGI